MVGRREITSGRARRAIKMGELASQVGSSYLWTSFRRAFLKSDRYKSELLETHLKNARRLVESSAQLRGAFMKLIQMLSIREDLLPAEALDVLKTTQSNLPPMDYDLISAQIRRELGKRPEQIFANLEPEAFAAASLGQVHRGRLKTGEDIAVKIQYPGVDATLDQDLYNLKLVLRALKTVASDLMRQKIDTRAIYSELEEGLRQELDYVNEAGNIEEFRHLVADDPEVMVPRVIKELSSRRVLTMTYIDGYPLTDVFSPAVDAKLRAWVSVKYYTLVWRQVLEFGVLHTDPHPGNYLVSYHPRLGVLDFGSMQHFSEPIRKANLQMARALVDYNDDEIAGALVKLGYLDRTQDPKPMVKVVHILFEPLMADRPYDPREYDSVRKAAEVGEMAFQHKLYKSPRHGIFVLRALVGLDGIMRNLGIKANYRRIFCECVERAEARNRARQLGQRA